VTRVLVFSFSDLASDPRVDRQIGFLLTRYDVVAAGLGPPRHQVTQFVDISLPSSPMLGEALRGVRLVARRYEALYWKDPRYRGLLDALVALRPDVVLANDLSTLPLALRLGAPVVFDAHEYAPCEFSERWWWRVLVRPYRMDQCRRYIPQVSAMTTVGDAIADAYERDTGVHAGIVTNAPARADLNPTPVHEPVRILHHGGAQPGRGLEEMIRVADFLDERFTLDFVLAENTPGYREQLIRRARRNARVRFPEPRPMHELVRMANDYDIGLYSLPPVNFNQRHALPNKFFEFVQARLAVAIGPSPEMARLVNRYAFGAVASDFRPESVAAAISALDAPAISALKAAAHVAADELCSERNSKAVLDAVESALAHARGGT
jgi:hypothetical protein